MEDGRWELRDWAREKRRRRGNQNLLHESNQLMQLQTEDLAGASDGPSNQRRQKEHTERILTGNS